MKILLSLLLTLSLSACTIRIDVAEQWNIPIEIYPQYQGVTIPPNIAPLNFEVMNDRDAKWGLQLVASGDTLAIAADEALFSFKEDFWKNLLNQNRGKELIFRICKKESDGWKAYQPFTMMVADDEIDPYLAYRLIPPGYSLWKEMGIYQRNLENFEESIVYKNREGKGNCVNCHSFCEREPEQMLFHMRSELAGTYILKDGKKEKINTKTDHTISPLVYPYWHPSGDHVAFSVNKTFQVLHVRDINRIEVCDEASDVVIYDVNKHEIITTPSLSSDTHYETFPTFSPDGKYIYFCSAVAVDSMPKQHRDVKYSLCKIAFNSENCSFGTEVDTLYNAVKQGKSISFPRVSPDGKNLVFTLSEYGNFSIWHKDSDLYSVDLETGNVVCLDALNSDDVESYHSWSSNSRWMVFSSRRENGLYTQPYIVYMGEDGIPHKPFLLPQQDPKTFYGAQQNSYNIPEFIKRKIPYSSRELSNFAHDTEAIPLK